MFGQQRPWYEQYEPVAPAQPQRIQGPAREPPPRYPDEAAVSQGRAAAAPYDARRAAADARRAEAEAVIAERNQQSRGMTSQQRLALEDRYEGLTGFDRQLGEVERLYRETLAGSRGGVLGFGSDRNAGGYLHNFLRPQNQTFNDASNQIIDQIATVYGITGGELNSLAELRARLGPYLPQSSDNDQTIDMKLRSLRAMLTEQRRTLGRQLGIEQDDPTGAIANGAAPPPQSGAGAGPGGPQSGGDDPNMLTVEVVGGRYPQNMRELQENMPEMVGEYEAARARNPSLTIEAFLRARRGEAAQGAGQVLPPEGRGNDPESLRQTAIENLRLSNTPLGAGLTLGGQALFGTQGANALQRGAIDAATFGLSDEIRAGFRGMGGEDFYGALDNERDIARFDEQNNFGARLFGQAITGAGLPFNPAASLGRQAMTGAGYGAAYGFGSGEGSNRLSSAAIGGTIGAGGGLLGGFLNRGTSNRRELLDAAQRQGVDITRLDAGGIGTRMAGGVVGRTFGNVPMVEGSRAATASAGAARDRIAGNMGTVLDDAGAGQAAQRGMRSFLDSSRTRGRQLEDRIGIPANREVSRTATIGALQELTTGFESNPRLREIFRDNRLDEYLGALQGTTRDVPTGLLDSAGRPITRGVQEGGTLSWQDLRAFRSRIGEVIEQPQVAGDDRSIASLRTLYGALSRDMEATAAAEGPRSLTAFRRYNQYWRGRESRRETIVSDILGPDFRGGAEQAFTRINQWAQQRGGNFANVARALRSMPEDEANAVRASLFGRMGQESAGRLDEAAGQTFNASTFATQWNNLSPRARSFLVPNGQHRRDLEDLVRVTTAMRGSNQYQNFSNTSLGTNAAVFASGLFVEPVTTLSLAVGSLAAGKFLASRAGAGWLARATRMRTPAAQSGHARSLRAVAARDPAIAQEALGLRQILLQAMNDNAPQAGRAAASPNERPDDPNQNRYR